MHSMVFFVDYQLSEYAGMGAENTQIAYPPLGCFSRWTVHYETVSVFVESSSGHETFDVGAVTEFSLGITTQNNTFLCRF